MQEFTSTHFGTVPVDPENVITFPKGIIQLPGFKECTRYHLFHEEGSNKTLRYLQSLDNPDILFTLIDPIFLNIDYEISLSEEESEELGLEDHADKNEVVIMLMMYHRLAIEGEEVTQTEELKAQTQSPLIINPIKRLGIQKIGLRSRLVFTNVEVDQD